MIIEFLVVGRFYFLLFQFYMLEEICHQNPWNELCLHILNASTNQYFDLARPS